MPYLLALLLVLATSANALAADDYAAAISERQSAFKDIKEAMKVIKENLKSGDKESLSAAANILLDRANKVTELFPAGSHEGDTRAKQKIWDNQADFTERQQALISHARDLAAAAQQDDPGALKAAFKTTSKDCKGCHMRYRQLL